MDANEKIKILRKALRDLLDAPDYTGYEPSCHEMRVVWDTQGAAEQALLDTADHNEEVK